MHIKHLFPAMTCADETFPASVPQPQELQLSTDVGLSSTFQSLQDPSSASSVNVSQESIPNRTTV